MFSVAIWQQFSQIQQGCMQNIFLFISWLARIRYPTVFLFAANSSHKICGFCINNAMLEELFD